MCRRFVRCCLYDIEMQTVRQPALAQRARLYQAHIDISQLQRGINYDRLKPCFVIFICKFDPFGEGLYRYTFRNRCEERRELLLNDGSCKLFFNTAGDAGEIAPELRALLTYMNDTRSCSGETRGDPLVRRIEQAVRIAQQDDDWRRTYMMYQVHQRDAELRGERRGEIRGERRGQILGERMKAVETVKTMLGMSLPLDMIVKISGLTVEEIEQISNGIEVK